MGFNPFRRTPVRVSDCPCAAEFATLNTRIDRNIARFDRLDADFETIIQGLDKMATNQERLDADIARLQGEVETNSAAITQLGGVITGNTTATAALVKEILDLKAANPDIDLSNLESVAGQLDAANNQAAAILAAAQTPV